MSTHNSLAPNISSAQSVRAYLYILTLVIVSIAALCLPRLPSKPLTYSALLPPGQNDRVHNSTEKYTLAKTLYMKSIRNELAFDTKITSIPIDHVPLKGNLWEEISASKTIPEAEHHSIAKELEIFVENRFWIQKNLNMARPYLSFVVHSLSERNLPLSLALLPVIESSYNPNAKSENNAVGLWQLIPHTGEALGLKINEWLDERKNVELSTKVALDYLESLYAKFDSWPLALAAYNAGPSRIKSKITKTGLDNPQIWDLDLPKETRKYVAKFFALRELIINADHLDFKVPVISTEPVFTYVNSPGRISLYKAAVLADMNIDELLAYNSDLLTQSTPPEGPHNIAIPVVFAKLFQTNLKKAVASSDVLFEPIVFYVVKSGDILGEIALKHNTTISKLRRLNGITGSKIKTGQKIKIFTHAEEVKDQPTPPEYRVKQGDTLSTIAKRFGVNSTTLIKSNHINNANLVKTGKVLVIPAKYNPKDAGKKLTYTVKSGDTLSTIAEKFDVTISRLKQINPPIATENTLFIGQSLVIHTN